MATFKEQCLLDEWKDIRETLRYFGIKRFSQLTVFLAATGFLASRFLERNPEHSPDHEMLFLVRIAGIVFAVGFLVMEWRSSQYIQSFAKRGLEIEAILHPNLQLFHRRPSKGFNKFLKGTYAVYSFYVIALGFWLYTLGAHTAVPG